MANIRDFIKNYINEMAFVTDPKYTLHFDTEDNCKKACQSFDGRSLQYTVDGTKVHFTKRTYLDMARAICGCNGQLVHENKIPDVSEKIKSLFSDSKYKNVKIGKPTLHTHSNVTTGPRKYIVYGVTYHKEGDKNKFGYQTYVHHAVDSTEVKHGLPKRLGGDTRSITDLKEGEEVHFNQPENEGKMMKSFTQFKNELNEATGDKKGTPIVSKGHDGMYKLVHSETGEHIKVGDEITNFRGEKNTIHSGSAPHKPSSTGFVHTTPFDRSYAGVYNLEWKKMDANESVELEEDSSGSTMMRSLKGTPWDPVMTAKTATSRVIQRVGNVTRVTHNKEDDFDEDGNPIVKAQPAVKRGRGRPAGSNSGARTHGNDGGAAGEPSGHEYSLKLPTSSVYFK